MIGKNIDRYKIIDKLGEGGMGVVYKAEDSKLNRIVALKALSPHLAQNEEARERFFREAQAASGLNHANITTVYDFIEDQGQHYICMECVEGKTVKDMTESGQIGVKKAVGIILQAAEALNAAHQKKILHRDVKSANIMVSMEGNVKVMDFGLAHLEERSQLTRTGTTLGTLAYSSPEQLTGHLYDERSEIWSLGVVFHELLTGHLPFRGPSEGEMVFAIINNDPDRPSKLRDDVLSNVDSVAIQMLDKDPALRYSSMAELIADLQQIRLELETSTVGLTLKPKRWAITSRRRIVRYLTAALITTVIAVVAVRLLAQRRPELDRSHILLTFFDNPQDDQVLNYLKPIICLTIIDRINRQLTSVAEAANFTEVLSVDRYNRQASDPMANLNRYRDQARKLKVGTIIDGALVRGIDDSLQVHLTLYFTEIDRSVDVPPVLKVGLHDTLQAIQQIGDLVMSTLARNVDDRLQSMGGMLSSSQSLEAMRVFTEGLEAHYSGSGSRTTLPMFRHAATLDSLYFPALMWAARNHYSIRNDQNNASADSLLEIVRRHADVLTRPEQFYFRWVDSYGMNLDDYYQVAREAADELGGDYWIVQAAINARVANRPREAIKLFNRIKIDFEDQLYIPGGWSSLVNHKIIGLNMLGRHRAALRLAGKWLEFRKVPPSNASRNRYGPAEVKIGCLAQLGRVDELIALAEEYWTKYSIYPDYPIWSAVKILFADGDIEGLERLMDLSRARFDLVALIEAEYLLLTGDIDAAEKIFEEYLTGNWELARRGLGIVRAKKGDRAGALAMENWLRDNRPTEGLPRYNWITFQAQIAAHLGDVDRALELIEETLLHIDPWDFYWDEYPFFEPLWGNPTYEQYRRPGG